MLQLINRSPSYSSLTILSSPLPAQHSVMLIMQASQSWCQWRDSRYRVRLTSFAFSALLSLQMWEIIMWPTHPEYGLWLFITCAYPSLKMANYAWGSNISQGCGYCSQLLPEGQIWPTTKTDRGQIQFFILISAWYSIVFSAAYQV